jgi:HEAT repeat protein/energy-coupling factor transporter ATP-binding protein EcfA2
MSLGGFEAWFFLTVRDKVFSYASEKGSDIVAEWARDKLGLDPRKEAFKRALEKASQIFEKKYPQWVADLFNIGFFEHEAAPILAQFLIRDGNPSPSELAILWARSLNISRPEQYPTLIRELEPVAADFLDYMASALKAEQALSDLNDSRVQEQIARKIETIKEKLYAGQATPGSRFDYLDWVMRENRRLDIRGLSQTQFLGQVKLEEVYISLQAHYEMAPSTADRSVTRLELTQQERKRGNTNLSAGEIKDRRDLFSAYEKDHHLDPRKRIHEGVELAEVIKNHSHVVILGDPGSGKSTLLRYLALTYAQAVYFGRNEAGSDLGPARFPILIRLAYYAEHGMPKGQSLSDFLTEYYRIRECPRTGLADLLATELAGGNCIILLDGLDEIVSADDRRKVTERVEDFVRSYDNRPNRFVITSRRAGYRDAPLSEPFVHYVVDDMNETQIQRFLEHWCAVLESVELSPKARQAAAQHEIDAIMRAVREYPGVYRLATNPLLLCLLVQLHRTIAYLPRRRIELYQAAAGTLARNWRLAQHVPESELVADQEITRLLSRLAYWLHENKPTGLATEREVCEVLGKEWARIKKLDWDEDNLDIEIKVKKFLRTVREHTGIFVEFAPNQYGFMHLTFEEYYASRYLVGRRKDQARLIRKHLHQSRWEESILLGLSWVSLDYPEDAEDLVETAILAQGEDAKEFGFAPSAYEEVLGRDYLFVLRCLGESIPVRPETKKRLLKRMVNELLYETGSGRFHHYHKELVHAFNYLRESEEASVVASLFIEALPDVHARVHYEVIENLGLFGQPSLQLLRTLYTFLDDVDPQVSQASHWSLRYLSLQDEYHSHELITFLTAYLHFHTKSAHQAISRLLGQFLEKYTHYSPEAATAFFLTTLPDPDPKVRSIAAWNLRSCLTTPEVVVALVEALQDPHSQVRRMAVSSLGKLSQTTSQVVAALTRMLSDSDPQVRKTTMESLEQLLGESFPQMIPVLTKSLHDPDSKIRAGVVRLLGKFYQDSPEVVAVLIKTSHDLDPQVRNSAVGNLKISGQGSSQIVEALIEALHDPDPQVRNSAVGSLKKSGQVSSQIVEALIKALHDDDSHVRTKVVSILGDLDQITPEVVAALIEALHDSDPHIRNRAASSLGGLDQITPEVVAALIEALHDSDPNVRATAASSLGSLDQTSPEVVAAFIEALHDSDPNVLTSAVSNLKKSGQVSSQIALALIKALHDSDPNVRVTAASSLGELDQTSPEVVAALIEALHDSDPPVRVAVVRSLGYLSKESSQAATAFIEALREAAATASHKTENLEKWDQVLFQNIMKNWWSPPYVERIMIRNVEQSEQIVRERATLLIKALPFADSDAVVELAHTLGMWGQVSPDIIRAAIEAMQTSPKTVHLISTVVAASLGQSDQTRPGVEDVLIEYLENAHPQIRGLIVEGLKRSGLASPLIVQSLVRMLNDGDIAMRKAAIESLGQLDQKGISSEVIAALLTSLHDKLPEIRSASIESLGKIGQDKTSGEIIVALSNSLNDDNFKVRYTAAECLRQLGQNSSQLLNVQLEALNRKVFRWGDESPALLLGRYGGSDEAIIQSLWEKLRDEKYPGRLDCAQALALLGRRFPDNAEVIGKQLALAIEDPELSKTDTSGWSGHSLAYEALRLLVADGESNKG